MCGNSARPVSRIMFPRGRIRTKSADCQSYASREGFCLIVLAWICKSENFSIHWPLRFYAIAENRNNTVKDDTIGAPSVWTTVITNPGVREMHTATLCNFTKGQTTCFYCCFFILC